MEFIVRCCINQNFAKKTFDEKDCPIKQLVASLGKIVLDDTYSCYLTFGLLIVTVDDKKTCEKIVRDNWARLFPNEIEALDLLIVENTEGLPAFDTLKIMYTAYFGWESYLKLCTDIYYMVPTYKKYNALPNFRAQNYFVVMDPGCGFTTMVSSFSDYLSKVGVFEEPKTFYSEYCVGKETLNGTTSTEDIYSYLSDEENYFQTVGIDVSYFLDKSKHDDFRKFLIRLSCLQDKYIFMFRVPYLEKKALKEIRDVLADLIEIKDIIIQPYNDVVYYECLMNEMWSKNIQISDDIYDLYSKKIAEEKKDGRFYAFKTVYKVINEVLWYKINNDLKKSFDGQVTNDYVLSKSDVCGLVSDEVDDEVDGYEELASMIGMEKISERIKEIVAQVKIAQSNKSLDKPCLHMRFVGAPGTGKTTVARIIGKIFKKEGILRKGYFFEYMARNLCGEFVGQTAPKTLSICRDAYGSVLFIDEAYSLYEGSLSSGNDYGREALTALIAEMENHRDDMVVIMAGYTDDMDTLMEGNAGLRSRMPFMLEFTSYTKSQLFDIFISMVKKHFSFDKDFENEAKKYFDNISDAFINSKEFANARFVRNLYERTWSKAALRTSFNGDGQMMLRVDDFVSACSEKEFSEKLMTTKKIGF